ncbi:MAG: radical SAM protein, partial [Deltaproteobacteria bacterium]|nr:radical SAM protein [Deltaproteobacteria bacterium]
QRPAQRRGTPRACSRHACARDTRRPLSAACILTHRCNFRCTYCDIPDRADAELTAEQWLSGLGELRRAGLLRASFSGGEALLRPDAAAILAGAKQLGLTTSLNSNGWLTGEQVRDLAAHLDLLMISLDGPAPEHDAARRKPGSFDRALQVLDQARDLGIATTSITVLTPANLHVVEPMLKLATEHGFFAYFQPAYQECFGRDRGLQPGLTQAVLRDVADRLAQARAQGLPVGASPGYLRRLAATPGGSRCETCRAGRQFLTILPDGTFVPCHLTADERTWPSAAELGFLGAFEQMPRASAGTGCAISPYQELDLIFSLDPAAIRSAILQGWRRR